MPGYSRGFLKMSFRGICGMGYCFNKYLKKKKKISRRKERNGKNGKKEKGGKMKERSGKYKNK